ncbi:MAG TPA: GNAT family N-acetyltransferase [Burkholderiales bacterium]|nr:GNAT family N-acetyltransferase [Burkholderiales bacterium]
MSSSPDSANDGATRTAHAGASRATPELMLGAWSEIGAAAREVRTAVFVVEQRIPAEEEWDEWDAQSLHAVARDAAGSAIGTGRLLPPAFDALAGTGHIGRMAVLREARGTGVGGAILRALMRAAPDYGFAQIVLHAQSQVANFYARHGFIAEGAEFLEVGIPHVLMRAPLRQ